MHTGLRRPQKWVAAENLEDMATFGYNPGSNHTAARQVLELLAEPGCVSAQLHEVHHKPSISALLVHRGLCSAGDAAVRGTVSMSRCGRTRLVPLGRQNSQ